MESWSAPRFSDDILCSLKSHLLKASAVMHILSLQHPAFDTELSLQTAQSLCLPCYIWWLKINPCGSRPGLQILSLSVQLWQGHGRNCVISGKGSIWGIITSACSGISCQEFLSGIVSCGNASAPLQPSWWAASSSSWALPLVLDLPVVP